MQILLAEDDGLIRAVLERALVKLGYEVVAVDNGRDAWALLSQADGPQMAVLDWMMPGMDGIEICRRLRQRVASTYTYAILLTAKNDTEDIVTGLDAGADDYIVKPFHHDELGARLRVGRRIVELERQLLAAKELLRLQAQRDALTDVLNRGAIQDELRHELRRAQRERRPLGVVMVDLDHFKTINDTYGHQAGDDVLREAAVRMKQSVREYDSIGRYGGEEFLLMVPGCGADDTVALAERIRHRIAHTPFSTFGAGDVLVTASLGVGVYVAGTPPNADALVRVADEALYRAKRGGRNRVEVAPPPDTAVAS
ncbi:MAG: diguanylate cyclase [Vicinamibacterales bacterium]